jgi:DNA-binding response OmpR family regulator
MLLELFLRYPEQVFSRETLLERLWSLEDPPNDEVVKAHIKGLRDKLREAGVTGEVIETVFGHGYRLKAHV